MWTELFSLVMAPALLAAQTPDARGRILANYCPGWAWWNIVPTVVLETPLTNVLTVDPAGRGETLEAKGITLRVQFLCKDPSTDPPTFEPIVGLPAESIGLYSPDLAHCGPILAAQPTDENGWTEFHGTFQAGGCVEHLLLFADGVVFAEVPLRLNSPDSGTASSGRVDDSDLGLLATRLGRPEHYSICFDFNEDGSIDSGDLAYFATVLGSECP
jgi:hypothetical protein